MDYWIWLASIEGLGSIKKMRALQKFRCVERFYNASKEEILSIEGYGEKNYQNINKSKDEEKVRTLTINSQNLGIRYVNFFDDEYPKNLKNIYDMPITLFYKGDLNLINRKSVAVIGSRNASDYGLKNAYTISRDIVRNNYVVISGAARGVDSYAHKGALNGGGKTIGVLGCGLDIVYPSENQKLYREIINNGLLISEYIIGTKPEPMNFPIRNRIISGLADKIVVVEAALRSGTSITVECALEQGKDVYAVPRKYKFKFKYGN